jgi:O-acetyl-ADP-ribose deacetylase (regulator of RNase III)
MRYPAQCVDGRVHMEGGSEFKRLLSDRTCPVGDAVVTRAVGNLSACGYKYIIHTVPPLASDAFQVYTYISPLFTTNAY